MDTEELHLIVDWTSHFAIGAMIKDINESNLEVINVIKFNKLKDRVETMCKFYGEPNSEIVVGGCAPSFKGKTPFHVYLILDKSPVHGSRKIEEKTATRYGQVNTKVFDLKYKLRKVFQRRYPGYRIHGSNNIQEAKDNLRALEIFVDADYNVKPSNNFSIIKYE